MDGLLAAQKAQKHKIGILLAFAVPFFPETWNGMQSAQNADILLTHLFRQLQPIYTLSSLFTQRNKLFCNMPKQILWMGTVVLRCWKLFIGPKTEAGCHVGMVECRMYVCACV
jgi:hypothetical protein